MTALPDPVACRSCRAPVVWAIAESGKQIPVDPTPDLHGNLAIHTAGGVHRAEACSRPRAAALHAAGVPLYLAHFVNCPHAGNWRKR